MKTVLRVVFVILSLLTIGIAAEVVLRSRFTAGYTPMIGILALIVLVAAFYYLVRFIRGMRTGH